MRKIHPSIKHTAVHLGVSSFLFLIAIVVALFGSLIGSPEEHLAQTGSGLGNTTTSAQTGTTLSAATSTLRPVLFGVSVATDGAFCENGVRKTVVAFFVSPIEGGNFRLLRLEDGSTQIFDAIPLPLQNGTYRWEAIALPGYMIEGNATGEFSLSGSCPSTTINPLDSLVETDAALDSVVAPNLSTGTAATTTSQSSNQTLTTTPPALPITSETSPTNEIIAVRAFQDDQRVEFGGEVKGPVELRVVRTNAKSVRFVDEQQRGVLIGDAQIDDLLSNMREDMWVYQWDTTRFPDRSYSVKAVVTYENGEQGETLPLLLVVKNPVVSSSRTIGNGTVQTSVFVQPPITESENILTRVASPEVCRTPRECELYCVSSPSAKDFCSTFVLSPIDQTTEKSITNPVVEEEVLDGDGIFAVTPTEFDARFVNRFSSERVGARVFIDSDSDGISDFDEINLYHTDPKMFDSDGDGSPDGAELLSGTNPLGGRVASSSSEISSEEIARQTPKENGVEALDILKVDHVAVVATTTNPEGKVVAEKIAFSGRTIPNTFVTLFIFSDPIVVTVKSDATGAWTYILDRELPDGTHEVYSAIADAGGKIVAKSAPLPFVKQAAAVTIGSEALLPERRESPGFFSGPGLIALVSVLIGVLGIAVSIVGFTVKHHHQVHQPLSS